MVGKICRYVGNSFKRIIISLVDGKVNWFANAKFKEGRKREGHISIINY